MADGGLRAGDLARRGAGAGGRPVRGAARAVALVAAAAALALLAGCGTLGRVNETRGALREAGFRGVEVSFWNSNGALSVTVEWRPASRESALQSEGRRVAEVVWHTAKLRLDGIRLAPQGVGGLAQFVPRSALVAEFGPRDPDLDEYGLGFPWGIVAGVATAGVLAIVLIVVLVRRTNRRSRAAAAYPAGAWGAQPGWPAAPPAPPGWPAAPPGNPDDPYATPPG
ncbi:MAG TPA: hypothetical protein VGX28_14515 [Frankiaceae bacterium]|nr:hypothetical protein [Frankiaceae bacterium]